MYNFFYYKRSFSFVKYGLLAWIVFIILPVPAQARLLTTQEIQRVKVVKQLLGGIDTKSLRVTIIELEKTQRPLLNIEMKEAMARTYTDMVREFNVEGQKKKEWLYSMVCLNMAYFQFGGGSGTSRDTSDLNRLIRQKLKEYLPPNALEQPGFVYSLE